MTMLGPKTVALVFIRGRQKHHVLVLESSNLRLQTLGVDLEDIESLSFRVTEALRPQATGVENAGLEKSIHQLSYALLGPLRKSIQEAERLVVVADGPLENLPFELLRHPTTNRWLVESHEISYLPSFSVLARLRKRSVTCGLPEKRLLVLGDPIFGPEDPRWPSLKKAPRGKDEMLAPLPGSRKEAEGIESLDPQGTTLLLGSAATRKNLLPAIPKHHRVHLASHAFSETRVPALSKIALSCIDSENRVVDSCDVYFSDVVHFQLCGQLVVLSACGSARGRALAGEGVLGLPWAFLRAGASSVVASLWDVADGPTADLMVAFHRYLDQGKSPATALSLAKREMISLGVEKRHWAPFILLGDWKGSTFPEPPSPIDQEASDQLLATR
jgi:CHAT domain-containing protein